MTLAEQLPSKGIGSAGENLHQAGCQAPNSPVSRLATGFHLLSRLALATGGAASETNQISADRDTLPPCLLGDGRM